MLIRAYSRLFLAGTLGLTLGAVGCGDDDGGSGADATPHIDGTPDGIDAAGEDTSICPEEDDFNCPEGGEVRLEYIVNTDPNPDPDINTASPPQTRTTVFFMTGMDPDKYPLPALESCTALIDGENWPRAQGTDREYVDAGDEIVISGGAMTLHVAPGAVDDGDPKTPPPRDPIFRTHDQWWFHNVGAGDGDIYTLPNRSYSVFLPGSDTWPAELYEDAVFIPNTFTPTSQLTQFALVPGEDMEVTWDVGESDTPEGALEVTVIAFSGAMGPTYLCPAINDGSFTIPAATVDAVIALGIPGILARQTLVHQLRELGDTGRRLDMQGVWCYVTPFTLPAL